MRHTDVPHARDEPLEVAGLAAHAQKALLEPAALQVRLEFLPDIHGQGLALLGQVRNGTVDSARCEAEMKTAAATLLRTAANDQSSKLKEGAVASLRCASCAMQRASTRH